MTMKNSVTFIRSIALALTLWLMASPSAFGQVTRGSLAGTITDPTGAALPAAAVTLKNPATGAEARATTDSQGAFVFPSLAVGRYAITVEAKGFKRATVADVVIEVSTPARVEIALEVGATSEQVTIAGGAQEVVNTSSPMLTNVVERKQIVDLPLPSRNPLDLIRLQAGITTPHGSDVRGGNAAGLRGSTAEVTQDGVNVRNNFLRTDTFVSLTFPSVESTGEFSVSIGTNSADAGRGVAQVRIVTPTGTNDFHGSLFEYHRSSALNANTFFNNATRTPRPFQIQNRFGFLAGGPLWLPKRLFGPASFDGRNRSFWFLTYEGFRQPFSATRTRTVLTEQARQGDFRYIGADGQMKTVSLLNIGNARALNPVTKALIDPTPLPNTTLIGDGLNTAGYRFNRKGTNNNDKWSGRFDQALVERSPIGAHKLELVVHRSDFLLTPDFGFGRDAPFPGGVDGTQGFTTTVAVAAIHSTFGSRAANEVRFGAHRSPVGFLRQSPPDQPFFIGFNSITNPVNTFMSTRLNVTVYHFRDHFSLVKGAHTLRAGAEAQSITYLNFSDEGIHPFVFLGANPANPDGILNSAFPNLPAGAAGLAIVNRARTIYYDLTGALGSASQTFNVTSPTSGFVPGAARSRPIRQRDLSLYAQDQWRPRRNLSLNYGLRWEFVGVPQALNGLALQPVNGAEGLSGISGLNNLFNPGVLKGTAPTLLDFAGEGAGRPFYANDWNNFAPSIGFAYSPDFKRGLLRRLFGAEGQSSIRGGFSISYVRDGLSVIDAALGTGTTNSGLIATSSNATPRGVLTAAGVPIPVPEFKTPISDLENYQRNPNNGLWTFDSKLRTPYVQQWSFGIEREIARGTAVEARYVGNHAVKLYRAFDVNEINIFENGFLQEFLNAQKNLAVNRGASFASGAPGTAPLPIFATLFAGLPAASGFANTGFINNLNLNTVGTMAFTLASSPVYAANRARLAPNFFRANPNAAFARLLGNGSFSNYHALQVELRRRFSRGLMAQANYTFGKTITDSEGFSSADLDNYYTLRDLRLDRHRNDHDITHTFVANFIYELPFGPRRRFLKDGPGVVRKALEGWQVQGIIHAHSGPTGALPSNRATVNQFKAISNPPVLLGGMSFEDFRRNSRVYRTPQGVFFFNPQFLNITTNADGTLQSATLKEGILGPPAPGTFGTFPRNAINFPAFFQVDAGIIKRTYFSERGNVEFRAEFFNLFNRVNFGGPSGVFDSPRFRQIVGTDGSARIGQVALRVNW